MSKHTRSQLLNFKNSFSTPHCFPRKFVEVYKISLKEHFILSNEFKTAITDSEFYLFVAQINVKCERDAIFCQVL